MADTNTNAAALPETGSEPTEANAEDIASMLNNEGTEANESDTTDAPDEGPADVEGDDGEDEANADSDDPDETPDASSDAELYDVTVNGKIERVNRKELLAGYSRQRDYTVKTEQLASERKQVEAIKAQHQQALQNALNYAKQDPILAEAEKLDWAKLANDDPAGFVQKQFAYNQRINELQQMQKQLAATQAENLEATGTREAARLLEMIPEWKDKAKAQAGIKLLSGYLTSVGFTDQELKGFTDSRAYQVAYDAARWRNAQAAKTTLKQQQVTPAAGRTVKPGATTNQKQTNSARIKQLDGRAARSGSMDDQLDAIMARL